MWLLPFIDFAAEASDPTTTFAGFDPKTQTLYDWFVCHSGAVFLGTEIGRTCTSEEGLQRTEITFRVERSFKGRLPKKVNASESGCASTFVDESGVRKLRIATTTHPVAVAPTSVMFLVSPGGPETLGAGFPEASLIPVEVASRTVARVSDPRSPDHIVDLAENPLRTMTFAVDSDEVFVDAADWLAVLDQLDAVVERQLRDRCSAAFGTSRATKVRAP